MKNDFGGEVRVDIASRTEFTLDSGIISIGQVGRGVLRLWSTGEGGGSGLVR